MTITPMRPCTISAGGPNSSHCPSSPLGGVGLGEGLEVGGGDIYLHSLTAFEHVHSTVEPAFTIG
jgi:hypothetical protein